MLQNKQIETKIIYLYDLPAKQYTSVKLAQIIQAKTGYKLQHMPQVRRELNKPFYSALIKIDNPEKYQEVVKALRYFDFEGHPCRGLPYQTDLLGSNVQRLQDNNLFVRKLDKDIFSDKLEERFKEFGDILSCKVSINEDYTSRGYGFICYKDQASVEKALNQSQNSESFIGVKYAPKTKGDIRKSFNNIFVKNLPQDWNQPEILKAFGVFGNISSILLNANNIGKYAFICYGSTNQEDREYGFIAASNAVAAMDNKEIDGKQLYCRPAQTKAEREKDIQHESQKYKNSKKRCNLFVKGFASQTTEQELFQLFAEFGEIESLKISTKYDNSPYAFVCFKTPDSATQAKTKGVLINNIPLTINHYELKEQRDLQNEAIKDKNDFTRYLNENQLVGPQNYEQITSMIQMLLHSIQKPGGQHLQNIMHPQNRAHSQPHHNQGQNRGQHYQGHQNRQNQVGQNNYGNRNQQHSQPRPLPLTTVQQVPIPTPMPMAPQGFSQQVQFVPSQDPMAQELYSKTLPIYAAITEINPSYKQVVGSTIFEFVTRLAGQQYAPKITGMLIDLPIPEIQRYATNFDLFAQRIQQALQLLSQQSIAQ